MKRRGTQDHGHKGNSMPHNREFRLAELPNIVIVDVQVKCVEVAKVARQSIAAMLNSVVGNTQYSKGWEPNIRQSVVEREASEIKRCIKR